MATTIIEADSVPEAEALVDALAVEPERVREFFPLVSNASDQILPGPEKRPLVLIPRAEAWADS